MCSDLCVTFEDSQAHAPTHKRSTLITRILQMTLSIKNHK